MARLDKYTITEGTLIDIGDAIRSKTGGTADIDPVDMPQEILDIPSGGGGEAGNIEDDVVFFDYDGTILHSYTAEEFLALTAMPANPSHEGLTSQGWNWTLTDAKAQVQASGAVDIGQLYEPTDGWTHIHVDIPEDWKDSAAMKIQGSGSGTIDWGDGSAQETFSLSQTGTTLSHAYSVGGSYEIRIKTNNAASSITIVGDSSFGSYLLWGGVEGNYGQGSLHNAIKRINLAAGFSVGDYAFAYCADLEAVSVGSSVTSFGAGAFYYCYGLMAFVCPPALTTLSDRMFGSCYKMKLLSIGSSVTSMGSTVFASCEVLQRLVFPESMKVISSVAPGSRIKRLPAPVSVTTLGNKWLFTSLYLLTRIRIPVVGSIPDNCFKTFPRATSITIPSGIREIGTNCFTDAPALIELSIPGSVTTIGAGCFSNFVSLKKLTFNSATPPTVQGSTAFANLCKACVIHVPSGSLSAYKSATNYPSSSTYTYVED